MEQVIKAIDDIFFLYIMILAVATVYDLWKTYKRFRSNNVKRFYTGQ